jgi:GntR family transcriptional regulator/MocR family aminotransferase
VVTPSHQFPLGATLPAARRLALLDWAARAGAWILEDDYDSEFRYRGPPSPALKSLDAAGRVLYAGTFGKVLFPGLRLGYLVAPEPLLDRLADAAGLLQPAPAVLGQAIAAAFMDEGHFPRHIRRMRALYAVRRAALVRALQEVFDGRLRIAPQSGGMHLVAYLPDGTDDVGWVERARRAGILPAPLSLCAVARPAAPGLLLGFTNVAAEDAPAAALRLRQAVEI